MSAKQDACDRLTDFLDMPREDVDGIQEGTVPARVFQTAAAVAGVAYRNRAATTEDIIRYAGLPYHPHYDSRRTTSRGGGNVTVPGLNALYEALLLLTGWDEQPEEAPEWAQEQPTPRRGGQYRNLDPVERKKIEDAAQDWLMQHFIDRGWYVTDTRFGRPYDAVAVRGDQTLFLEAKGTKTRGDSVIVTRGEVNWAINHPGQCVLGIWSEMEFDEYGDVREDAGVVRLYDWYPDDEELLAIDFDWDLPPHKQIPID